MFHSGKHRTYIEFSFCVELCEVQLKRIKEKKEDTMKVGSCESVHSEKNLRAFLGLVDYRLNL